MQGRIEESCANVKKAIGTVTKTRYNEFHQALKGILGDAPIVNDVLKLFCETMRFDPNMSTYTPELGKKKHASLKKRCEETGKSTYELLHARRLQTSKCSNYLCESRGHDRYNNYCIRCFVHMFPDNKVVKRYKTKEASVVEFIKSAFPQHTFTFDKSVDGGCSRYRPDMLLDCLTHSIIIEVDENQHDSYDCTCENKRTMTLFQDLGHRPLVMIRFNPDDYVNAQGAEVKSCFTYKTKNQLPMVSRKQVWEDRLNVLKSRIEMHLENVPLEEVTIEHLFYDGFE